MHHQSDPRPASPISGILWVREKATKNCKLHVTTPAPLVKKENRTKQPQVLEENTIRWWCIKEPRRIKDRCITVSRRRPGNSCPSPPIAMAQLIRSAKSGSDWTIAELLAYNVSITPTSPAVFFFNPVQTRRSTILIPPSSPHLAGTIPISLISPQTTLATSISQPMPPKKVPLVTSLPRL